MSEEAREQQEENQNINNVPITARDINDLRNNYSNELKSSALRDNDLNANNGLSNGNSLTVSKSHDETNGLRSGAELDNYNLSINAPIDTSTPSASADGIGEAVVAGESAAGTAAGAGSTVASGAAAGSTAAGTTAAGAAAGSSAGPVGIAVGAAAGAATEATTAIPNAIENLLDPKGEKKSGIIGFIITAIIIVFLFVAFATQELSGISGTMIQSNSFKKEHTNYDTMYDYYMTEGYMDADLIKEYSQHYVDLFHYIFHSVIYNGTGNDVIHDQMEEILDSYNDPDINKSVSMQAYYHMNHLFDNINYAEILAVFSQDPNWSLQSFDEEGFKSYLLKTENLRKFYILNHEKICYRTEPIIVDGVKRGEKKLYMVLFQAQRYNLNSLYTLTATPITYNDKHYIYNGIDNYNPADKDKTNPSEYISMLPLQEYFIRSLAPDVDFGLNARTSLFENYQDYRNQGEVGDIYKGNIELANITDAQILADIAAGLYTMEDYIYMAACMQAEGCGSDEAAIAVGYCLMNRLPNYGSIQAAVSAKGQFASPWAKYLNGSFSQRASDAAVAVLRGTAPNPIGDCYYFFGSYSVWGHKPGIFSVNVGGNVFYVNWGDVTQIVGRPGYVAY